MALPKILFFHPGCAPFVQNDARSLYEAGLLGVYVTTYAYQPGSVLGRTLKWTLGLVMSEPEKQLARRQITEVPGNMVRTHPVSEMIRMTSVKFPLGPATTYFLWEKTELWFDNLVARKYVNGPQAVYGYEHAALSTFQATKRQGGVCIYDIPMCHHTTVAELLEAEFERFPEIQTPYDHHIRRLAPRRNARKDKELQLADLVIVNSRFPKESLMRVGVPEERISVVPFGAPPVSSLPMPESKTPFIFLSAGSQSVRKGVHYLLEAWRRLSPGKGVELWLVGPMQLPSALLANLPGTVVVRVSVPRKELSEIYHRAGVLVFPSLCDAFGAVITEAMAHGLPVITTPNTGGPELIRHGENGFLVPIRDAGRLAEMMQWCLDHPVELSAVSKQAETTAAGWQWSDYRALLAKTVTGFLSAHWNG